MPILTRLAVVEYLTSAVTTLPVLVVGTHRDWPRSEGLDRLATSSAVIRLALGRLPDGDVAALVEDLAPVSQTLRDEVVRRAEGLPMVVRELVEITASQQDAAARPHLPRDLAALVEAQLAALTPVEQRLLAAAALLGPEPDWDLVAHVAGVDEATVVAGLRHAVQSHLLVTVGEQWAGAMVWFAMPSRARCCLPNGWH
jgi:hypothetical protein